MNKQQNQTKRSYQWGFLMHVLDIFNLNWNLYLLTIKKNLPLRSERWFITHISFFYGCQSILINKFWGNNRFVVHTWSKTEVCLVVFELCVILLHKIIDIFISLILKIVCCPNWVFQSNVEFFVFFWKYKIKIDYFPQTIIWPKKNRVVERIKFGKN